MSPDSASHSPYQQLCALAGRELSVDQRVQEALTIGCAYFDLPAGLLAYTVDNTYEVKVTNPETAAEQFETELAKTWCRHVVEQEAVVAVADVAESQFAEDVARKNAAAGCYIGAPVVVDGELFGVLSFRGDHSRAAFTDADRELVSIFADWIGAELKQHRQQTALETQNERLTEFAGIVAHDLRNPLAGAIGYTELAQETASGELVEFLARVRRSLDRMESLITDCLMLAKEGEDIGSREPVSLAAVAEEAWEGLDTRNATISIDCEIELLADRERLLRLLENLFRNAVEHGGPTVSVSVSTHPAGFTVANDGPPLPDAVETALTTGENLKSFGLGLLVVSRIVSGHGWTLTPESSESGVQFHITGINVSEPIALSGC